MKANELMIGDWVQNPLGAKGIVKNIKLFPKESDGFGGYYIIKMDYSEDGDSYSNLEEESVIPIPLTDNILLKNDFVEEEREGDPTFPYSAFVFDGGNYRIEVCWFDSHDKYEANTGQYICGVPENWTLEVVCKEGSIDISRTKLYVHQLQHALKLCGIDKEIVL